MNNHVIKKVAREWHELGIELVDQESVYKLNIIKVNHKNDVVECCSEMFEFWLKTDTTASWNTLIVALQQIGQNELVAIIKKDVLKGISLSSSV